VGVGVIVGVGVEDGGVEGVGVSELAEVIVGVGVNVAV